MAGRRVVAALVIAWTVLGAELNVAWAIFVARAQSTFSEPTNPADETGEFPILMEGESSADAESPFKLFLMPQPTAPYCPSGFPQECAVGLHPASTHSLVYALHKLLI